ncbi:MAG: glutathione S-transferase family protein [Candidatus Binatia bacterium]
MVSPDVAPLLLHFQFSHFNEKARWALDWKRVPHRRRALLPGAHLIPVRRLTGQRQVPALGDGGRFIPGSAAIIDHLEQRHPEPPLYPRDAAERARALELQRWFDDHVGGLLRAAFFFHVLPDAGGAADLFSGGRSPGARALYRAVFPLLRIVMRREMDLTPERAARGLARGAEALDLVATQAGRDGYLVGGAFSVADLTAAALLGPAVLPPQYPYRPPEPYAPALTAFVARFADHPGAAWVRTTYARHRGVSAEIVRGRTSARP